jgi:hypothetical protein
MIGLAGFSLIVLLVRTVLLQNCNDDQAEGQKSKQINHWTKLIDTAGNNPDDSLDCQQYESCRKIAEEYIPRLLRVSDEEEAHRETLNDDGSGQAQIERIHTVSWIIP